MIWLWIGIAWAFAVVGIWALVHGAAKAELPPCVKGCHLDLHTGVMWHSPGCPNLEQGDESDG